MWTSRARVFIRVWIWTETRKKLCPDCNESPGEQSFYFPFYPFWFHFVGGCRGQAATYWLYSLPNNWSIVLSIKCHKMGKNVDQPPQTSCFVPKIFSLLSVYRRSDNLIIKWVVDSFTIQQSINEWLQLYCRYFKNTLMMSYKHQKTVKSVVLDFIYLIHQHLI